MSTIKQQQGDQRQESVSNKASLQTCFSSLFLRDGDMFRVRD